MSKYFFWASGSTKMEQPFLSGPVLGLKPWAQHRKYREKTPKEGEKLDRRGPQGLRVAWGRSPVCPSPGTAETSRLEPPIGAERKSRRRLFPMTARRPEKGGPREQKDVSAVPTLLCQIPMEHAGPPQCHGLTRHWTSTAFAEVMVRPRWGPDCGTEGSGSAVPNLPARPPSQCHLQGVDLRRPACPHVHLPGVTCNQELRQHPCSEAMSYRGCCPPSVEGISRTNRELNALLSSSAVRQCELVPHCDHRGVRTQEGLVESWTHPPTPRQGDCLLRHIPK